MCIQSSKDCEFSHQPEHITTQPNIHWEHRFGDKDGAWLKELPVDHEELWSSKKSVKESKRLVEASELSTFQYHRYPMTEKEFAKLPKTSRLPKRFLGPSTWPALETARLSCMQQLHTLLGEWLQEFDIRLHPSVFEFEWVQAHIDEVRRQRQAKGSLDAGFEDDVLPSNGLADKLSAADEALVKQFVSAGCTTADAERAVWDLHEKALGFKQELHDQARGFDPMKHIGVVDLRVMNERFYHLVLNKRALKISAPHYNKLRSLWMKHRSKHAAMGLLNDDVFCLLARTLALSGGGSQTAAFHAGVAPKVIAVMDAHFGKPVIECFASPLNAQHNRFCSLSLDIDYKFGSLGSFFHFTPKRGVYFAHPPSLLHLVNATWAHINQCLQAAGSKKKLTFVLLIQALPDSTSSEFLTRQFDLAPSTYSFFNGHQHRKDLENLFHAPNAHQSTVFFLQTPTAAKKQPITDTFIEDLISAFSSKMSRSRSSRTREDYEDEADESHQAEQVGGDEVAPPSVKRSRFE